MTYADQRKINTAINWTVQMRCTILTAIFVDSEKTTWRNAVS